MVKSTIKVFINRGHTYGHTGLVSIRTRSLCQVRRDALNSSCRDIKTKWSLLSRLDKASNRAYRRCFSIFVDLSIGKKRRERKRKRERRFFDETQIGLMTPSNRPTRFVCSMRIKSENEIAFLYTGNEKGLRNKCHQPFHFDVCNDIIPHGGLFHWKFDPTCLYIFCKLKVHDFKTNLNINNIH